MDMANLRIETHTVRGMACPGCEAVIEEALSALDGVRSVKADFSGNKVTVTYDPGRASFQAMALLLKKKGYVMTNETKVARGGSPDAAKKKGGEEKPLSSLQFLGLVVALIAIYLIIDKTVGFHFIPEVKASMGYGVLLLVGLLTSLHCVAMCGGINMSLCMGGREASGGKAKLRPSLLYNLGRVTSYTVLGGIIGAAGSVIGFSGWARGVVAVLSGIFMILMGLSMTGLFPRIHKITPRLPKAFRKKAGKAGKGRGPYVVGLLNGFMPCGPLQAMQLYALGTGSLLAGALSMLFFSLGTVPLMFGLGTIVTILGGKFTRKMMQCSAVLVAVLGVVMLGRGLVLSGVPLPAVAQPVSAVDAQSSGSRAAVQDGVQSIASNLAPGSYPTITVQKGIPVKWKLKADPKNLNGCNRTLIIPKYNIEVDLKAGDNIIEFTPTDSGTVSYSCWMGMIRGQIQVVDDLGSRSAQDASDDATANAPVQPGGGSCCAGLW